MYERLGDSLTAALTFEFAIIMGLVFQSNKCAWLLHKGRGGGSAIETVRYIQFAQINEKTNHSERVPGRI